MRKLYAIVVIELVLAIIIFSVSTAYADESDGGVYSDCNEMAGVDLYQMNLEDIKSTGAEDEIENENTEENTGENISEGTEETIGEDVLEMLNVINNEAIEDKSITNEDEANGSSQISNENNKAKEKLSVTLSGENGDGILNKEGTVLYTAEAVTFTVDTKERCYYSLSIDGGKSFGGYVEMEDNALTMYPNSELSRDGSYQLRFKSYIPEETDSENSEEVVSRIYKLQFDFSPPVAEVLNPELLENWMTKEDTLRLKIRDDYGIARIATIFEDEIIDEKYLTDDDNKTETGYEIILNKKAGDEHGRAVELCVTDMAGNVSSVVYRYYLDEGKPLLYVTGDESEKLINEDGQLLIGLRDDCPRSTYLCYEISRIYKGENTVDEIVLNAGDIPGAVLLPVKEDGVYHVTARAFDMAGNCSNDINLDFVVDNEAPRISISGINAECDSKSGVDVSVNVIDDSYENSNVKVSVLRKKGDGQLSIRESEYTMEAVNDTRTISLLNDGDYTITVTATDGRGRSSNSTASFRIDATAPLIRISGLNENEITNSKPVIRISALESFYDATIMTSVLSRKDAAGNYVPVEEEKYVMKGTLDYKDISIGEEGEYRLECNISDRTGNSVSDSLDFTVDYTPPVINGFSEYDGKFLGYFNVPEKIDSLISDMTGVSVNAYINDKMLSGGETILDEGKYVLYLAAKDEADNYSDDSATFIIDHTAPQIVIKGVNSDGYIKKDMLVNVSLLEEGDHLEEVIFNGRKIELDEELKNASFMVDSLGDYDIEVKARDEAGNFTDKIIHTSCVMSAPIDEYVKQEKIIAKKLMPIDKNDFNFSNYIFGVITMVSGTMGLVLCGLKRD